MSDLVVVPIVREFPYPVERAFAWLTDYQEDDPARTQRVVQKREVVKRDGNVVTLAGENVVRGIRMTGQADIHLFPAEHRWEARFTHGGGKGSLYTYQLTPTATGCRLVVRYGIRARRLRTKLKLWLARPVIKRELNEMWDGFADAMRKDLG